MLALTPVAQKTVRTPSWSEHFDFVVRYSRRGVQDHYPGCLSVSELRSLALVLEHEFLLFFGHFTLHAFITSLCSKVHIFTNRGLPSTLSD